MRLSYLEKPRTSHDRHHEKRILVLDWAHVLSRPPSLEAMNKLNTAGTHVIDAEGKEWDLNVEHPMPLPDGITLENPRLWFYGKTKGWGCFVTDDASHWMLRNEPPAPKTQEEMDEEAFNHYRNTSFVPTAPWRDTWHAALSYARSKP